MSEREALVGYAQRFERRAEFNLFGEVVPEVIDASFIREKAVDDLKVIPIADVFSGSDEIVFDFGKPNMATICPNGKGGYQKFAVKSLHRGPSKIEDVRLIQSGLLIRPKNLPPHAAEKMREGMKLYEGQTFITCVNGNMHSAIYAGFGSGDKPLTDHVMPYSALRSILKHGLTFEGQKIEFDVIRTTTGSLESHSLAIVEAVCMTIPRHVNRNFETLAKKNKAVAAVKAVGSKVGQIAMAPLRLLGIGAKCVSKKRLKAPVAPALPLDKEYRQDLRVRISKPGIFAGLLRRKWGAHTLFELQQARVNVDDYLPNTLEPFPQKNPDFVTRVKKRVLMSPTTVGFIRWFLAPGYYELGVKSEVDIFDMLRTHSEESSNVYNLVITTDRVIIARTTVGVKFVDWLLSKHIVLGGWGSDKRFGGECYKDRFGVLHINGNSGTLRPDAATTPQAVAYVQAVCPGLAIVQD
ncbi:MAG: hypothetical protein K2Z81_22500 [Cyanobacteria bacterium]|nr:hypothetical protein [Cyanobacteriota bacterium]